MIRIPYINKLPKYYMGETPDDPNNTNGQRPTTGDIDNSLGMKYIRHLENSDSVGWNANAKQWRPVKRRGYDPYAIGIGLDMRDPDIVSFLKKKGRTANPWLSEEEERSLRTMKYLQKRAVVNRFYTKNGIVGDDKDAAIMTGMAYQGHPMLKINTPGSVTRNAVQKKIDAKQPIGESAFNFYYNYDTNKQRYADRIAKHNSFVWPTKKK